MFFFKKAVEHFLVPPGIFVLILMVSGLFFLRKSLRMGLLNIGVGLLIWLLSIGPVTNRLMNGLQAGLKVPSNPKGDVIILLGGGASGNVPTDDTFARIAASATLYRQLHVPIIVSGGSVYAWKKPEAQIDARVLAGLGVPEKDMILEGKSRDTLENAEYVKAICEARHFTAPLLVTSTYHMRRSLQCFWHEKMRVTAFPADLDAAKPVYGWVDYLPGNLRTTSACLHEYLGILYENMVFKAAGVSGAFHTTEKRLGIGKSAGNWPDN